MLAPYLKGKLTPQLVLLLTKFVPPGVPRVSSHAMSVTQLVTRGPPGDCV